MSNSGRHGREPIVRSRLVADLAALGVRRGAVLMVHARLGSIGAVVGTSQTVVESLLEVVGPDGTLMAYTGWDDNCFHLAEQPARWREAIRAELPGFDPLHSRARRQCGPFAERLRTWPGARRSNHPEASFVALGAQADRIVEDQERQNPYGERSPLGHLVALDGQVLMLGAPLDQITLVHHAEAIANVPVKRRVRYEMPVRDGDSVRWEAFDDIDTSDGAFPYADVLNCDVPTFLSRSIDAGELAAARGHVGRAACHLFSAPVFARYATAWMEQRFGTRRRPRAALVAATAAAGHRNSCRAAQPIAGSSAAGGDGPIGRGKCAESGRRDLPAPSTTHPG